MSLNRMGATAGERRRVAERLEREAREYDPNSDDRRDPAEAVRAFFGAVGFAPHPALAARCADGALDVTAACYLRLADLVRPRDEEAASDARARLCAARRLLTDAIAAISGPKPDWARCDALVDAAAGAVRGLGSEGAGL